MTFSEALNGIRGGQMAWRLSWSQGRFIKLDVAGNLIDQNCYAYVMPNTDRDATDWMTGRTVPVKAVKPVKEVVIKQDQEFNKI